MDKRTMLEARIRRVREKIAARPEPCHPECPGWAVFDGDTLCRCDECFYDMPEKKQLTDTEVELLPEAQAELQRELDEARVEEDYWINEGRLNNREAI